MLRLLISVLNDRQKVIDKNYHADIQPPWRLKKTRTCNQLVKHVKNKRTYLILIT